MAELRIEKPTLVTQVEGAVFVMDADGTLRRATPGMQLEPGMRLLTESDGRFELAEPAGEAPDASQPEQGGVGPAGAMNPELATLQEAIRQGADPTELFEETAAGDAAAGTAGGVVGSSAGGFVVVIASMMRPWRRLALIPIIREPCQGKSCSIRKIRICWRPSPSPSPRPPTTSSTATRRPASSFAVSSRMSR